MAVDPYLAVCVAHRPTGDRRGSETRPAPCFHPYSRTAAPPARRPRWVTPTGQLARTTPLPALEPPPRARRGATPHGAPPGGVPRKKSRVPSPAAPRTSRSRPANWPRTRPPARAPDRGWAPGHRGAGAPWARRAPRLAPLGGPASPGTPAPPAPAHRPTGRGQGQREKTRRAGNIPRGVSCAAPGSAGLAGLCPPGAVPPPSARRCRTR